MSFDRIALRRLLADDVALLAELRSPIFDPAVPADQIPLPDLLPVLFAMARPHEEFQEVAALGRDALMEAAGEFAASLSPVELMRLYREFCRSWPVFSADHNPLSARATSPSITSTRRPPQASAVRRPHRRS